MSDDDELKPRRYVDPLLKGMFEAMSDNDDDDERAAMSNALRVSNSGPNAAIVSISLPYTIGAVPIGGAGRLEKERAQHEDERAQWAARLRVLEHERAEAVEAAQVAREERDAALARVDALLLRARGEVKP